MTILPQLLLGSEQLLFPGMLGREGEGRRGRVAACGAAIGALCAAAILLGSGSSPAPALSLNVNFIVTAVEIPEYGQFLAETTGNNDRPTAPGREHGTARNSSARNSSARHSPASCCRLRNCCRQHMIRVRMHAGDLNRMSMRAFTCACLHAHPRKQMAHTYGSPVLIRMYTGTHNAHVCMSVHIERTAHTRGFV